MKKLIALVLALALVFAVAVANAVTITVNRDSTYQTGADGDRDYSWYRVFTVVKNGTYEANGGGYDSDGTPGDITTKTGSTATAFAYTASLAVANKLGTYTAATNTWEKADNQDWFKLTPIAGTNPQTFSVEWVASSTSSDTAQDAAAWLFSHEVWDATGSLTGVDSSKDTDGNFTQWAATDLAEGYYLLKGSEGQNLVAATTNVNVNEKNSYPTVDKKQKDSASGTYGNNPVNVKVGDTVYYQIEVKVPADANKDIIVVDKMSDGLTYDSTTGVTVTVGDTVATAVAISNTGDANYKEETAGSGETWKFTIHPTDATKGKYVVFTFQATINNSALTQTSRVNDVELKYNNDHYKTTDHTDYDIGAAAIIKYDGATADLNSTTNVLTAKTGMDIKYLEASFTLTDSDGNAINVKEATTGTKGVYVVATDATDNAVTSDKTHDGIILIYGLDPDVTYTLTETGTEAGYNRLESPVTLSVVKAEKSDVNTIKVVAEGVNSITAGNSAADADHTLTLAPTAVNKVANNQGTVLPSTGGIGTTIFYILGGLLVIGAAVILVARRKAQD